MSHTLQVTRPRPLPQIACWRWLPSLEMVFPLRRPLKARHPHPESPSLGPPATAGRGHALFGEGPRTPVAGAGHTGQ